MGQRGVQHSRFRLGLLLAAKKKVANAIIFLVVLVLIVLQEGFLLAEGRATKHSPSHQPRRKQKFRAGVGKDFSEFLIVMGVIMTCVIAPVFLIFLHSILKDPAVPGLAREAWKAFKKKFISYLGQEATRSPQGNPSSGTLATIDKSHILSPPLRREDRRHDLPGTIRDGDEDGAAWESDEDATKFAARSTESRTRRSGGGRLDVTKYQPLLLHEYAPYLHRRFNSAGEGADDAYDKNTEKREPPTTATTPAAARRATAAPFTTTPITSRSSRTKSFTFLQQREREAHNTDHDYPYDDLCGVIGDDYDALLSTMISSRATGLTAQQRGDSVNYYDDVEDDIGTYGAGRPTSSGDGPGVMERWDKEGTIGKGEEKKNTPGDYGEGENTIFLGENDRDGVGGVYKTTHSRRKLIRNRRLRR